MTPPASRRVAPRAALLLLLPLLLAPAALRAQTGCDGAPPGAEARDSVPWSPPLDRPLSLRARDAPLRSVLDRAAAATRVRLAYSADLLPLDRRVCAQFERVPLGAALRALLRGTGAHAVVSGTDHVVLSPGEEVAGATPEFSPPVTLLDRVVVTGGPAGSAQRSLATALTIVDGERLGSLGSGALPGTLDGSVPGLWAWAQSPSTLVARYGSIRGASSFAASYPKVLIDGVEVANPLLLTQLPRDAVERVEVIRGPQGAALYGTDAISGVVNVVTRHDGTDAGAPRLQFRSGVGLLQSDFASDPPLSQEHELSLRTGSTVRSFGLTLDGGTVGDFVPEGSSRHGTLTGSARVVTSRMVTTGTLRLYGATAGPASSPVLGALQFPADGDSTDGYAAPAARDQSVAQYTLGLSSTFSADEHWTHTLVVGVDGDRVRGLRSGLLRVPGLAPESDPGDDGSATRGTFRLGTVGRFGEAEGTAATVSVAAEHSLLRQSYLDPRSPGFAFPAEWQENTGLVGQVTVGLHDDLFLTGGLREERNEGLNRGEFVTLPVLGVSGILSRGDVSVKLRGAYGSGIRPPRTPSRESTWPGLRGQLAEPGLGPERQSGVEAGADVLFGRRFSLQVTRFDQLASGLIQRVAVEPEPPYAADGDEWDRHIDYRLQNVGAIHNRGWEMQGGARLGRLDLSASVAAVDSRVKRVAPGYSGDLRPGDRMLEVPRWTTSLLAGWSARSWSASVTAYRASGWINYDFLALARDAVDLERPDHDFVGDRLRAYWRRYDGFTHLRASASRDVGGGFSLLLEGDNLLNQQQGEPDDLTVLPGRTLTVGIQARF